MNPLIPKERPDLGGEDDSIPRATGAVAVATDILSLLNDPRWAAYIEPVFKEVSRRYDVRGKGAPATFDGLVLTARCQGAIEGINKLAATVAALRRQCERTVRGATGGPAGTPDTRKESESNV